MHTPDSSPSTRPYRQAAADGTAAQDGASLHGQSRTQDHGDGSQLTGEEAAALAHHHRRISETSYLPSPADYLHVR